MRLMPLAVAIFYIGCSSGIQYPEGGYDYAKQVVDKDTNFYYYPIKKSLSRRDSFQYGGDYLFYKNFNEPNLSLRPLDQEVFRFVYSGWVRKSYIILLSSNKIIIKSGNPWSFYEDNENALNETEKLHLQILKSHYPLDEPQKDVALKHYLDSMAKLFPQLLDPKYFRQLELKKVTRNNETFETKIIPISTMTFDSLVNNINASGYWKLPFDIKCDYYMTDGDSFSLEANIKSKFNHVKVDGCPPGDTTKFAWACQQLVNFVHLEKEIHCFDNMKAHGIRQPVVVKDIQLEEIKVPHSKKKYRAAKK